MDRNARSLPSFRSTGPFYESAKLLVREDGSMVGTIGGCDHAKVTAKANVAIQFP